MSAMCFVTLILQVCGAEMTNKFCVREQMSRRLNSGRDGTNWLLHAPVGLPLTLTGQEAGWVQDLSWTWL